jgi:hypothetical protein
LINYRKLSLHCSISTDQRAIDHCAMALSDMAAEKVRCRADWGSGTVQPVASVKEFSGRSYRAGAHLLAGFHREVSFKYSLLIYLWQNPELPFKNALTGNVWCL